VSSTYSEWYEFNTSELDPLGMDDPKTHQYRGRWWYHHTSDIYSWMTVDGNGKENQLGFSIPEFYAMHDAMNEKLSESVKKTRAEAAALTVKLGEYQNLLHEARQEIERLKKES
jgi:hypothetical protein